MQVQSRKTFVNFVGAFVIYYLIDHSLNIPSDLIPISLKLIAKFFTFLRNYQDHKDRLINDNVHKISSISGFISFDFNTSVLTVK